MRNQTDIERLTNHRKFQEHALKRLFSIDIKMTQSEYDDKIAALGKKFEDDLSRLPESAEEQS